MADLDAQFAQAQADVKTLTSKPSNDDLLTLYALFKQSTAGEASGAKKPGRFDLVGKAKYEAWTQVAGTSADEAKTRYIAEVDRLLGR
ncbi:acyl-CoA-binding protein [uncultured Jatrophihabitans sp.]|uniref:acyl-CoA-binding protein n=1 Tax=uncultured Jatrophihabitans sp. TaxID=1610747 RepID=UPI0035CB8AB2